MEEYTCKDKRNREMNNFIHEYVGAIRNGSAAVFAGAGLSIPSGEISWTNLLREDASSIGLDIDREEDLIAVAQYIYNESGSRNTITKLLKKHIDKKGSINDNHQALSGLPIDTFWTTNYDTYIERSLEKKGKIVDVKRCVNDLSTELENSDAVVYKMHGDITSPEDVVLIKDDYEVYDRKNELFISKLRGDLLSKTFLFIGFSFDDPNLERILAKLKMLLEDNVRRHYCFLKKVSVDDPEISALDDDEKEIELKYRQLKQDLKINDLMRYGIKVVLMDDYQGITDTLGNIRKKYLHNKVFISGSIDYVNKESSFSDFSMVESFCQNLSGRLSELNNHIVTGMGRGVGRSIVTGVFNKIYSNKSNNKLNDEITISPFPANLTGEEKRTYRKDILKDCGVAIFIFGNKNDCGEKLCSDGMIQEYEIAKELGLIIVPVGCTGFVANKIWQEENGAQKSTYLERLNDTTLTSAEIINIAVEYIESKK